MGDQQQDEPIQCDVVLEALKNEDPWTMFWVVNEDEGPIWVVHHFVDLLWFMKVENRQQ